MAAEPRQFGARHPEVRRLRALLRDPRVRAEENAYVLEGPRVVTGALDRGAQVEALYLGAGAGRAFAPVVERAAARGATVAELKEGVLEKLGRTVTPQPVLGVAAMATHDLEGLGDGLVLVAHGLADPGNAGTVLRSAEAAGASGVVFTGESVDPYNPKTVRASAGAIAGSAVVVEPDVTAVLDRLAAQGRHRVAAAVSGGTAYTSVAWPFGCAIVLGNEARGLEAEVTARIDEQVTIPMSAGESLNVAMAATVLAFTWRRETAA